MCLMRPVLPFILLFAWFSSAGSGLQMPTVSSSPSGVQPTPEARVIGHVTLADTGKPGRNAAVLLLSLDGQHQETVRAGFDGEYVFEHVVPGEYIVVTYLDGYLSPFDKLTLTSDDRSIAQLFSKIVAAQGSLKVGAHGTQSCDISLERGASVSGRVLYSDGTPAVQVDIELENTDVSPSAPDEPRIQLGDIARSEFDHRSLETDDEGHFRIAGIPPGKYRIAAVPLEKDPAQMLPDALVRSLRGAIRYYDKDTIHPGSAKIHTLAAGQEVRDLELRIPLEGFHSVRGEVLAADGRRIAGADVTATETSDPAIWLTTSVHDGFFRFDRLPSGTYKLTAPYGNTSAAGGAAVERFGPGETMFTLKDADLNNVRLTLPAASGAGQ